MKNNNQNYQKQIGNMLTKNLRKIISDCSNDFKTAIDNRNIQNVLVHTVPILWFGDIDAYRESKRKIVTVALNPSVKEFGPKEGPYSTSLRFGGLTMPYTEQNYYDAMNDYFKNNPYGWFCSIECMLNELDASFGGILSRGLHYENTAVHIDIKAPVATNPTWGELSNKKKYGNIACDIEKKFGHYYSKLINELNPDIIMISVNENTIARNFQNINGVSCTPPNAYDPIQPNNGNSFIRGYKLIDDRILISGYNNHGTAFAGLDPLERNVAICKIKQQFNILP